MAKPTTLRGTQLLIKIGDGNSPEVFAHPCLINTDRGIQFQSQGNDITVPDCASPDDPAWLEHVKDGLSATVTGSGVLNVTDVSTFDTWFRSGDAKNVQIWLGTTGSWEGAFHLTEWQITGTRANKAECSITLRSDGDLGAYTPA